MITSNRKNTLLKVVILGDGGVGKSCLMSRFVSNNFDSHSLHTVGVEFFNKDMELDGECYTLQLWDTAGQERFKSLRTPFYRGTDICILTYAVNDKKSFDNLSMWKREFILYSDIKDNSHYPFLVVGSKVDLANDKRQVEVSEALDWCEKNGQIPLIETSAKDAINVDSAFALAVEQWNKLEECLKKSEDFSGNSVNLNKHAKTKGYQKSECCS